MGQMLSNSARRYSKYLLVLVIACIISFNLGNFLIFMSIKASNATIAAILELSYPLFTVIFTWLLFRISYITPGILVGSAFIILGVCLIFVYGK